MHKKLRWMSSLARDKSIDLDTLASLMRLDRERQAAAAGEAEAATPCKIAFVAASPCNTEQLRLGEECLESQRELKLAPHRGDFAFESRWATTVDELIRFLNETDPAVIHVAGHGSTQGLVLQDDRGGPDPISPRALAMIIRVAAPSARLVVLNTCSGLEHAEAVRGEVDAVVAMAGPITDIAARLFAARLYGGLGCRKSIGTAVAQGVARLAAAGLSDESLPRCLTRDDIDAERIVLSGPRAALTPR